MMKLNLFEQSNSQLKEVLKEKIKIDYFDSRFYVKRNLI